MFQTTNQLDNLGLGQMLGSWVASMTAALGTSAPAGWFHGLLLQGGTPSGIKVLKKLLYTSAVWLSK